MAIAGEAGELAAEFQWLTHEESTATNLTPNQAEKIRLEIADILIYLLRLSDELGVDVVESVLAKMAINEERFPLNQKG
jgi:NTP pyrophosphatase (non-canonical NTP hydrolase)